MTRFLILAIFCLSATFSIPLDLTADTTTEMFSARNWSPDQAQSIKRQAENTRFDQSLAGKSAREFAVARKQQFQEQTGYGLAPHGPVDERLEIFTATKEKLADFQRQAERLAQQQGVSVREALSGLMTATPQADPFTMTLTTPGMGAVTGGGYVYVFDAATSQYLSYSSILGTGEIELEVEAGRVIDILVFPQPPFAFQAVRDVIAQAGQDVDLQDSVEIDVSITNSDDEILDAFITRIDLTITSFAYNGNHSVGYITGNGSIYLAAGESYRLTAIPDPPYLYSTFAHVDAGNTALQLPLERGNLLDIVFEDPQGLTDMDGCQFNGYLSLYRSQDILQYQYQSFAQLIYRYDAQNKWVGVTTAVPPGIAVDLEIQFYSNSGYCLVQDYRSRFEWFLGDQAKTITLAERPMANVIVQTPDGTPVPIDNGTFYETDGSDNGYSFYPDQDGGEASLIAGKTYAVTVSPISSHAVTETIVVAQSGPFDVIIETQPLVTVKSRATMTDSYLRALAVELYQEGTLVEAFELSGAEVTMEIPAGDYDVRLSGISGQWTDGDTGDYFAVILLPQWLERTVQGLPDERMDFHFDLPGHGVRLTIPNTANWNHVTAYHEGVAVAATTMGYWYEGILTDLPVFELEILGYGFPSLRVPMTATTDLQTYDLTPLQEPVARLQGTITDGAGTPLPGLDIQNILPDGIGSNWVGQSDGLGQFDIPKIKGGLVFVPTSSAGNTLMEFTRIEDYSDNEILDIRLEEAAFLEVSREDGPVQLLYGTGNKGFKMVFIAEAYTDLEESITDTNGNGVWDGAVFIDTNVNGVWDNGEPYETYGTRYVDPDTEAGTDLTANNESFTDLNADGYPNIDDFSVFVQNSRDYIRSLLGTPGIDGEIDFDAYILFLPSAQAGVDVIDTDENKIIDIDTLFGGMWRMNRSLLSADYGGINETLQQHLPDWDLRVVMLNQPVRIGRANSFILAQGGIGHSSPNNFVSGHEFGHNPGRLSDEYNEFSGTYTRYIRPSAGHITNRKDPASVPWAAHIPSRPDLPIAIPYSPQNGIYPGAVYNNGGAYRSNWNSRMRFTGPLFNDASIDILSRSYCHESLVEDDFNGPKRLDEEAGRLFTDAFETRHGQIQSLCE